MIDIKITGIKELRAALNGTTRQLPKELATAVNATAKKVSSEMSKQVRTELVVKAADVKKVLKVRRKATQQSIGAVVQLSESARLPLKYFNASQKRTGVSYKISKTDGRRTAPGAFISAKLGGHAFKRTGKARLPITKLYGASPGGVYTKKHMEIKTIRDGSTELTKQINKRIRFILLKKQGLI